MGYIQEIVLGFVLASALWMLRKPSSSRSHFSYPSTANHDAHQDGWANSNKMWAQIAERCLMTFFDCAVYFSAALEIASILVLVRKDYSISLLDFGAFEAKMTWAISTACILPLLYPMSMLPGTGSEHKFRWSMFSVVVLLFFYPFYSQCIHNWEPPQVGTGTPGPQGEPGITTEEYQVLYTLCFGNEDPFPDRESSILAVSELLADCIVFAFAIYHAARYLMTKYRMNHPSLLQHRFIESYYPTAGAPSYYLSRSIRNLKEHGRRLTVRKSVCFVVFMLPLTLAILLLRAVLILRGAQSYLAMATNSPYADNDWTFGQIIAVAAFVPVVIDGAYTWWFGRDR